MDDVDSKSVSRTQERIQSSFTKSIVNETTHERSSDSCVICLQPVTERAIAVPCNHWSFDFICLASWLDQRAKCPLCNIDVSKVQYDWRSPSDYKTYDVPQSTTQNSQTTTQESSNRVHRNYPRPTDSARNGTRRTRPLRRITEDEAVQRRRHIYRCQLYSLHVGSNRVSRYRNITPTIFNADADLQSRARKWIRRELRVFSYLVTNPGSAHRTDNVEFLLEYVVAILKTVDIKDSGGQAENLLSEFIGRADSRLFLHELHAWLRSPYINLEDWDRHVQYNEPRQHARDQTPDNPHTLGRTKSSRGRP